MSCVGRDVRHIALAILLASAPAAAEEADPDFVAMPGRAATISFVGQSTRVHGVSEGGSGASLELAVGSGRWQLLAEGMFANSDRDQLAAGAMAIPGRMLHAGGGLRWLARQFIPEEGGGFELYLSATTGVSSFYWDDGERLVRADLALGTGMQIRVYKVRDLTLRLDTRVLFAQGSTGFLGGVGFGW